AAGVHAVFAAGGNSLVVEDGGEALVVDTKFPPGSNHLARWVRRHVSSPVTKVVNTHYHYDHTQGNEKFPGGTVIAHERTSGLMLDQDADFWRDHRAGLPSLGVPDSGQTLNVGKKTVQLLHPGPAHTRADLVVYLPEDRILATGDLFFHTYYPFFDLSRAGASIPGLQQAIRKVAAMFPQARVVPGHGPLGTIDDFLRYADYLDALTEAVQKAIAVGQSEKEAVRTISLASWKRSVLPSFHGTRLSWGTRENNIRSVYRLLLAQGKPATNASRAPQQPIALVQSARGGES
ncbi:MAG: MBL fold metallo-hydrolase, partial [Myxococcales bacterium]|nr:MBL fold metallo-hydrolase [Myxococcales bacterium]